MKKILSFIKKYRYFFSTNKKMPNKSKNKLINEIDAPINRETGIKINKIRK